MGDVMTPAEVQYEQAHAGDSQQTLVRAVVGVAMAVGWAAVILRVLARRAARASLGWDDYTAFVGLAVATCCSVFALMMVQYGLGRHIIFVTNKEGFITAVLTCEVLYVASLPFLKTSLLFLYARIFPSKRLRHAALGVGVFVVAYSIVLAVCILTQCVPISSFWTPDEPAHCIDFAVALVVCSVCNILTDIAIIALPVPFVWNLRTSRSKRIQVLLTFLLGGLVTVISIVRTVLVSRPSSVDKSWSDVGSTIISVVEVNVGVLCTCLPTLRPLLRGTRMGSSAPGYGQQHTRPSQVKPGRDTERKSWIALGDLEDSTSHETAPVAAHDATRGDVFAAHEASRSDAFAAPARVKPPTPPSRPQSERWIVIETNIEVANEEERRARSPVGVPVPRTRDSTPHR